MPGRMTRSAPQSPFELPEVTAVVRATHLSCQNAGKAQKFTPVRGSSGESRLRLGSERRHDEHHDRRDGYFHSRHCTRAGTDCELCFSGLFRGLADQAILVQNDVCVRREGAQAQDRLGHISLLLCGIVRLVISYKDVALTMQGSLEIACGIAIFVLGPTWWANELMDGSSRGAERSPNSPGPPRGFYFS